MNVLKVILLSMFGLVITPVTLGVIGYWHRESHYEEYIEEMKTRPPLNRTGTPLVRTTQDFSLMSMVSQYLSLYRAVYY